jgi:hypothetical protein
METSAGLTMCLAADCKHAISKLLEHFLNEILRCGTSDAFTLNELKIEEFERATMARIGRCQI